MRRRRLRIALALLLVALMPFAMKQYVVQEYLVALLAIILVCVPVLLVLLAFVLLQHGVRRALREPNTSLAHLLSGADCISARVVYEPDSSGLLRRCCSKAPEEHLEPENPPL
jgi:hypothetical protein